MMEKVVRHPALWLLGTLFWVGALWYFSSQPGGSGPSLDFPHSDKVLHYICFGGGGFLVAGFLASLGSGEIDWWSVFRMALLTTALLGWLDEWHQCRVPGRSGADPWDWLADILGGATGVMMVRLLFRLQGALPACLASRKT